MLTVSRRLKAENQGDLQSYNSILKVSDFWQILERYIKICLADNLVSGSDFLLYVSPWMENVSVIFLSELVRESATLISARMKA